MTDSVAARPDYGPHPETVESLWNINPQALEQIASWIEMRGIRTPVSQVVGYRKDRLIAIVNSQSAQSIPGTGADTTITYDTIETDVQKTANVGAGSFTLPDSGMYVAFISITWTGTVPGDLLSIKQNGTAVVALTNAQAASAVIVAAKGDTIIATVGQGSGGALNLTSRFAVAQVASY